MKRKLFLLLPALAVMIALSLTSCSDDSDANESVNNELATSLTGQWYGEYAIEGESTAGTGSIAGICTKAVQGLLFNADGTGTCTQVLCNVASEPLSIYGGTMDQTNGRFHYTSAADGTVTLTRDGNGDDSHPKSWTLKLDGSSLSGMDGATAFQLKKAEDYQLAYLARWEETLRGGGNSEKNSPSFLTDWARCETVLINGLAEPQYLPWAANSPAKSDIPEDVAMDVNTTDGWEMAFCALSDPSAINTRYFGLYNKYKGLLRLFMFVPNAQAYGNEMAFCISCGNKTKNYYPFYNSMEYSIPTSKTTDQLNLKTDLITCVSQYTPFSWHQTPYTELKEASGVMPYWHCVDIDLTGYSPNATSVWRNHMESNHELMYIFPKSQNTSTISITGTMMDNMKGSFDANSRHYAVSSNVALHRAIFPLKTIGNVLTAIPGLANSCLNIADKSKGWIKEKGNNQNPVQPENGGEEAESRKSAVFGTIAFVAGLLGIASTTTGAILEQIDDVKTGENTKGNLELSMNAQIDLSGMMQSWKSLPDGGLRITPAMLKNANPNCTIGDGCMGLQEAPKVYVAKDALLSERNHLTMVKEGNGYKAKNMEKELRFISVLDPTSVKINLNTNVYKNIEKVYVTSFLALDANRQVGHSDSYRRLMMMGNRPTLDLGKPDAYNKLVLNNSTTSVKLYNIAKEDILEGDPISHPDGTGVTDEEKAFAAPKWIDQINNEPYHYYGSAKDVLGSYYIVDPQVYLPYSNDFFLEPTVPDFMVVVMIQINHGKGKETKIVKHFIPEYELVDSKKMKDIQKTLDTYYNNCYDDKPVGTVSNAPSVNIYDAQGCVYNYKAHKMLELVYGKVK